MSEKVLLTGISGFIAKHVAIELLNSGYEVLGTVRDINSVEVHQSKDQIVELLFDEDHSFDERILNEQFKF